MILFHVYKLTQYILTSCGCCDNIAVIYIGAIF